jgi:hypothetical protein
MAESRPRVDGAALLRYKNAAVVLVGRVKQARARAVCTP